MANHWAEGMYVLCWRDAKSNGRMRMSWHESIEKLRRDVLAQENCTDAMIYGPLRNGERLRALAPVVEKVKAEKSKAKKRKPKPEPVAA